MISKFFSLIRIFVLLGSSHALAADPLPQQPLPTLLEQLNADSREQRLQAERELIRRGHPLLEQLPSPDSKLPPSVHESLLRIRTRIELDAAQNSLLPSRFTLSGPQTLRRLFDELSRQTGNTLDLSPISPSLLDSPENPEFENTPYWQALDQIARSHKLTLVARSGAPLQLRPQSSTDSQPPPLDPSGSVRICWDSTELVSPPDKTSPPFLRCHLSLSIEPRLRGLYGTLRPKDCRLTTSDGKKISPLNPQATFEIPFGEGGKTLSLPLDYVLPAGDLPSALQFSGSCDLEIAAGEERFEFSRLNTPASRQLRKGNVQVTMQPVTMQPELLQNPAQPDSENGDSTSRYTLLVRYDTAGPPFESHRLWIYHNRTFIQLPDKRELLPSSFETLLSQGRTVGLNYDFPLPPEDRDSAVLVYIAPTRILTHTVDFRFPPVRFSPAK